MFAQRYSKCLVVEGFLLFGRSWKGAVRDDGCSNAGDEKVDVFQVLDLVVQRRLACHPVDRQRPAANRNRNNLWRFLFRDMHLLPVLVVSEVIFCLHHRFALSVEEGGSVFVALLFYWWVEHQLAVRSLPLIPILIEHRGWR